MRETWSVCISTLISVGAWRKWQMLTYFTRYSGTSKLFLRHYIIIYIVRPLQVFSVFRFSCLLGFAPISEKKKIRKIDFQFVFCLIILVKNSESGVSFT